MDLVCANCGAPNPPYFTFCHQCGATMPEHGTSPPHPLGPWWSLGRWGLAGPVGLAIALPCLAIPGNHSLTAGVVIGFVIKAAVQKFRFLPREGTTFARVPEMEAGQAPWRLPLLPFH
ncbi:MAG: zinc ribbon domain-containing protein [Chloroflexi bacterium]|nr:zinc ribbon domain-containing protein [Chloroflexota bacterium]